MAASHDRAKNTAQSPLDVEIVIPIKSARASLATDVDTIIEHLQKTTSYSFLITLACNGGDKESYRAVSAVAQSNPSLVQYTYTKEGGRGGALKTAWSHSRATVVAYMDDDLATDLQALQSLLDPLVKGKADLVIGDRYHPKSTVRRSVFREILSRAYSQLTRRALRLPFKDYQCGFKAIRTEVAQKVLSRVHDTGWFFDTELIAEAYRKKYRVVELPIRWNDSPTTTVRFIPATITLVGGVNRVARQQKRLITPERILVSAILLLALGIYAYQINSISWLNPYYSMATQAAATDWKAFLFGSLDAENFITLDKFPMVVWPSAMSVRLFGLSAFSMVLPHILAGVASCYLLYLIIRRQFGVISGAGAALTFLFIPVTSVIFRFNNPDSFLVLYLLCAAWALFSLHASSARRYYIFIGVFLGLAFQIKTLQSVLAWPAFAAAYIVLKRQSFTRRDVSGLVLATLSLLLVALWWPTLVSNIPNNQRPYIGSTQKNSAQELIIGYNGLSRLSGSDNNGAAQNTNSTFGGKPGAFRMFNSSFGMNIGLVLLPAVIALSLAIWQYRPLKRASSVSAQAIFWTAWLASHVVVFSFMKGTIHPYYTIAVAPAVAAAFGVALHLIRSRDKDHAKITTLRLYLSMGAAIGTVYIMPHVMQSLPAWHQSLVQVSIALGFIIGAATVGMLIIKKRLPLYLPIGSLVITLIIPIAATTANIRSSYTGLLPTSAPIPADRDELQQSSTAPREVVAFIQNQSTDHKWAAATIDSFDAASIQLQTGLPIMVIGGFSGKDNTLSSSELQSHVSAGRIRYFVTTAPLPPLCTNRTFVTAAGCTMDANSRNTTALQQRIMQTSQLCMSHAKWRIYDMRSDDCRLN